MSSEDIIATEEELPAIRRRYLVVYNITPPTGYWVTFGNLERSREGAVDGWLQWRESYPDNKKYPWRVVCIDLPVIEDLEGKDE